MSYNLESMALGPLQANCYLYYCTKTLEACLIDPGHSSSQLVNKIKQNGLKLTKILCTHSHFDHVFGVGSFKKEFPDAQILCHEHDVPTWQANKLFAMMFGIQCPKDFPEKPDGTFKSDEVITLGSLKITALHTPGHTPGSVCLLDQENKVCFTGDTLFADAIGRTDFPGGSTQQMKESLQYLKKQLGGDTMIHPGHMGPSNAASALKRALQMVC